MTNEQIKEAQQTIIDRIKHGIYRFGIEGKLDIGRRLVSARFLGFSAKSQPGFFIIDNNVEARYASIGRFQPNFYTHSSPENKDMIYIKLGDVDSEFALIADQHNLVWSAYKPKLSPFRAETVIDGITYTLSRDQLSAIKDIAEGKIDPRDIRQESAGENR